MRPGLYSVPDSRFPYVPEFKTVFEILHSSQLTEPEHDFRRTLSSNAVLVFQDKCLVQDANDVLGQLGIILRPHVVRTLLL